MSAQYEPLVAALRVDVEKAFEAAKKGVAADHPNHGMVSAAGAMRSVLDITGQLVDAGAESGTACIAACQAVSEWIEQFEDPPF